MYDRCNEEFYTPDRCVYTHDIPCYTQYNNVIPVNRRYIRHDTPYHERYMNGIQCITPVSNHSTSILAHRTPPHTLGDALYYTIDDILRPIRSYITSTQLICVVFIHVILSISIYWRLYNDSFDFIKHITTPPYYWLCLCILYIPMQWYMLFMYYVMNMLYHVVILVLYVIYQAVLNVYSCIYRNICFRVREHMNTYVIPFVFKCYLWVYIQQPSYVPLPIRQYIDFIMAPRTRSLTRASPDDPANPTEDMLYNNPNPRAPRRAIINSISNSHDDMDDAVDDTLVNPLHDDDDDNQIPTNRTEEVVIPSSTTSIPLRNDDIPQLITTLVNQAMRSSRDEMANDIRTQLDGITNAVRDTQRQQAEMRHISNMLLQSSTSIPRRNSITMPRQSDITQEHRQTNYVQISTPPAETNRSPNTHSTPYTTPMTTYTIPLERISLQHDEPVNIRTMHTRASALPTQNEFEAFASLSPANTTKRATSAFLDRVLKYLQFDKHDSELIAEARALTLLAQHLTWAELATELKSYADTNQEFTYSKDLFWRKKRDIYSSKFQSHYAQRQDIGSVLRDAISRNHNNDNDNAVQRDNTDEDSVYDIPQNRSRNSNNTNRNSGNNQRNNNRNQNNNHNNSNNNQNNQYNNNNHNNNRRNNQNDQYSNNSRSYNQSNNSYNNNDSRNNNQNNGNRNNNNNNNGFRRNNNNNNNSNRQYNNNNHPNNNGYSSNSNQMPMQNQGIPSYPQRYMNHQGIPIDIPHIQHVIPNNMYPQYQYVSTPAMHPQAAPQIPPSMHSQDNTSQPENMHFQ